MKLTTTRPRAGGAARRTAAAAGLTLAVALSLTACSGDDDEPDETPSASDTPSQSESVDPGRVSPEDLPDVPVIDQKGGAIGDLELGDCKTGKGEQTVTGTLTSSQNGEQDFLVTVAWTTATGDVMGRGHQVVPDFAKGDTAEIEITAKVAEGATMCVPGVAYGDVEDD